ncbi:hypothetical protein DVJ77_18680 [Dyella tabacisoli]|uniref:Secreted protein n=1 Tax=Dyella tabacisoli TaxID=2282381 RepID=A0A369UKU8_9GAMM|nr:hypothetical protein DVJ77_18680 [Dyella tabacisoli]
MKFGVRSMIHVAVVAGLLSMVPLSSTFAAQVTNNIAVEAQAQALQSWHENIKKLGPPAAGCWSATYPNHLWKKEVCGKVSAYRSTPPTIASRDVLGNFATRAMGNKSAQQAGSGTDYSALTSNLTSSAVGSFPVVRGVKSESGNYGSNEYTLQLNTNISDDVVQLGNTSPYCADNGYAACSTWQQFIYSTDNGGGNPQAFIQNWLFIGPGDSCPSGWGSFSQGYYGCYTNSDAVAVPNVPVANLAKVKLSGTASANGLDTVTFTYGTVAYAISQSDSTLEIASTWMQSEFNIVGDGSQSPAANFNSGSSLTVKLAVSDGSTNAPTCVGPANGGTTGEYNNLNLGACTAAGGATPSIQFTESN